MTAQIRSKAAVLVALLGIAVTLAACGGSSDSDGASSDPATSHAAADKLIAQAIGPLEKAGSARVDGIIDLEVKGVPRFAGPIQITANGVYDLPDGASVPDFDMDVGLGLRGGVLGGALVLAGGKGFIKLGSTGYPLPASISQAIAKPAPDAQNGLTKTAAMFYINPQDWQENAKLVGDTTVAGESVQHITADIQPDRFFADIARLTRLLTKLKVTQAVGLPADLTPAVRAALVRSVTVAKGEVWIGKDDHVLRKAKLQGRIVVAKRDQKTLYGVTSGKLDASIDISEVGEPHEVSAPTSLGSYSALELSLDALGEFARRQK